MNRRQNSHIRRTPSTSGRSIFKGWMLLPAVLALLALMGASAHATRYWQYIERYEEPNNPARPVSAAYLGADGDNYLSGAAFLPDGRLLMSGTAYGASFDIPGADVSVLGRDADAPDFEMPRDNRDRPNPPGWQYTEGAGYLVMLSSDYASVVRAVRFPWGSGSLTDVATGDDGEIYVTGIVGENFDNVAQAREVSPDGIDDEDLIFLGKVRDDLSGFEWCLKIPDSRDAAPKLRVLDDGTVGLVGKNAFHFSPEGRNTKATSLDLTGRWSRGVDFKTHAHPTGADTNSNTGWEPWRRPGLYVNVDGETRYVLYRWNPRLVGTNWSRRVSDSAVRVITFDEDGNILSYTWSDGGNTVMDRVGYDITRGVRGAVEEYTGHSTGLPFSTWGAGVSSFAHINRTDIETGEPLGYTLLASYLGEQNRPNGLNVNMLGTAPDNSVLVVGGSAWGLIETSSLVVNSLDPEEDYMGGHFIKILNETMSDIRFSSAVPGGGAVDLKRHSRNRSGNMAIASRQDGDRIRVAFVGGATENDKFVEANAANSSFGSGAVDGQYVILEMDALDRVLPPDETPYPTAANRTAGIGDHDADLTGRYDVTRDMNRSFSLVMLRDTTGKKWPAFYASQPEGDGFVDADEDRGEFTLVGKSDDVEMGGTERDRWLGGRDGDGQSFPDIEVKVTFTGPDDARADVSCNGQTVRLEGEIAIRESRPTGSGVNVHGLFKATKGDLGIADGWAESAEEVLIQFWAPARPAD